MARGPVQNMMRVVMDTLDVNERAGAIVAVAFIDNNLKLAILSRLREGMSADDEGGLFDSVTAPMQSLSAKIRIAYALGLCSKAAAADLVTLKDIRNLFAHDLHARDFSYPAVVALCAKIHYRQEYQGGLKPKGQDTPRERFNDAAHHFIAGLALECNRSVRPTPPAFLVHDAKHPQPVPAPSQRTSRVRPTKLKPG